MESNTRGTAVTCSGCGAATVVPFAPTPGRPVYCRTCFAKRPGSPDGGAARRPFGPRAPANDFNATAPKKHMLAQGRKAHFVYDALEVLSKSGAMQEEQRRHFVEAVFARGARQSSEAAYEYLVEKLDAKEITEDEKTRLHQLLHRYSFRR